MQVGGLIGFLFYGELSVDSASDSEKRNGKEAEDEAPERKDDRDLWLSVEGGGMEGRREEGWRDGGKDGGRRDGGRGRLGGMRTRRLRDNG